MQEEYYMIALPLCQVYCARSKGKRTNIVEFGFISGRLALVQQ
jgi:hypothetical protein